MKRHLCPSRCWVIGLCLPALCLPTLGGLTAGCTPRAQSSATAQGAEAGCRPLAHTERPSLPGPHPLPPASAGQVWMSIDVPLSVIESEVERNVPRTLAAEEDRPIGAPGQVTYRVTRGQPKLRAEGGRVTATLPVRIELSLCKPFGSLCIGYGSCTPAYDVKASWDLTLSDAHELPDLRLTHKVTEGCTVGIDVTEHVTRVVKEQLREAKSRIDEQLPPLAPWIDRAITELTRPSMLSASHCVALVPKELLLDGPTTEGGRLTLGIGLSGTMTEVACDAPPHRGRGLPVKRPAGGSAGAGVEIREHFPSEDLRAPLTEAIKAASGPDIAFELRDYALVEDGMLLEVELSGAECGRVWINAGLGFQGQQLFLENSRVLGSALGNDRIAAVEAALRVPVNLGSKVPGWLADLAIEERTDILGTLLRERTDLDLHVTPPALRTARVVTVPEGLWVLSEISSALGLKVESPAAKKK